MTLIDESKTSDIACYRKKKKYTLKKLTHIKFQKKVKDTKDASDLHNGKNTD